MTTTTPTMAPVALADQSTVFTALRSLAATAGFLPAAYIVVDSGEVAFAVQLDTPTAFEAWRETLGIDYTVVSLHQSSGHRWLRAEGHWMNVPLVLTGFGIAPGPEREAISHGT